MCIGLLRPAHTPKVKYSLSQLLLWLALSAHIQWPFRTSTPSQREIFSLTAVIVACSVYLHFRTSTPSQREIFSLTAVIVACSYGVSFQDQHTLPKRNILSKLLLWLVLCICISGPAHPPKVKYSRLCYCSLFSLLVCIGLLRPAHTPKVKYSLSKLLLWLALSARISQDQHTLPKRNILSHSCYCGLLSLLVYSGLSGPAHPPKEKYSLSQLLLWLALSARVYWPFKTSTSSQSEIFYVIVACSLCSCVLAFQDQHTSNNLRCHSTVSLETPASQREIFSQSCYCGLLCVFAFHDQHTLPK